ncbi:MAG: Hsp70 family protein [Candidatus Kapaibacterium sp.]
MSGTIDFGIDLGTTNSAIARYDGAEMRIFKNRDQMDVTPSVVQVDKSGRVIVGRRAYNSLFTDPDNVACEFKRWMGQSDRKSFNAAGRDCSAEELSAEVLKSLLEDARRQTGESIDAAVITVPAAFGQLQCEATARSARLAGLVEVSLIQEPVAAAIAYGMKSDARDKRLLVYDLGGGTFDVAVISTRDGQLVVLDHRGNNMLGGKDFDRLIVRKLLLPRLRESFSLPVGEGAGADQRRLFQTLQKKAEEVKIDLSFATSAIVSIFDAGTDADGREVEMEFTLSRSELNEIVEPLIAQTIDLCREAINGGRISADDLSTVVLVGGPTQMPIVREALASAFNTPLDFSIDPMTVVAQGAAIYAATSPRTVIPASAPVADTVALTLAYEPVWPETTSLVMGKINTESSGGSAAEIFIETESGRWNSGWLPIRNGAFDAVVSLLEGKTERFRISLRGEPGRELTARPDSFSIRHGLLLSEPPLPHSIGAEIVRQDGISEFDVIFPRSTPLPASKIITYKANRTLKPGSGEYIAIKLWEGEFSDPATNTFVGALKIASNDIRRPLHEGSDIELSVTINTSRQMEVHAFVPSLGEHFQENVYVAQENDPNLLEKVANLDYDIEECREKIDLLDRAARRNDSYDLLAKLKVLRVEADDLWVEYDEYRQGEKEPDDARRIYQKFKSLSGRTGDLERKISPTDRFQVAMTSLMEIRSEAEVVIGLYGNPVDKVEWERLCKDADEQIRREDARGLERLTDEFRRLRWRIVVMQDWFWENQLTYLRHRSFRDPAAAQRHLESGRQALEQKNESRLREAVRGLWGLLPEDEEVVEQKRVMESGIRRSMR